MRRTPRAMLRAAAVAACLGLAAPAAADVNWVGNATDAGQEFDEVEEETVLVEDRDNLWLNANNWSPQGLPTAGDDVNVDFDANGVLSPGITIGEGAVGRHVFFNNIDRSGNRNIEVVGDVTFQSLAIDTADNSSSQNNVFNIAEGLTLELTGGSQSQPTLSMDTVSSRFPFRGGGTMEFSGGSVWMDHAGRFDGVNFHFSDPNATINFLTSSLRFWGGHEFRVYSTQSINNLDLRLGGELVSGDGQPLDNFAGVGIRQDDATRGETGTVPEGTYAFLHIEARDRGGAQVIQLSGDVNLASELNGNAIRIDRRETFDVVNTIFTRGYDINIQTDTNVVVGRVDYTPGEATRDLPDDTDPADSVDRGVLDMSSGTGGSSTVQIPGNMVIAPNGVLVGDSGTDLRVGGNFTISTLANRAEFFDMSEATLRMVGDGAESEPQLLQVHGEDVGPTTDGKDDNFSFGTLIVGNSPTWVKLFDEDPEVEGGSAALYLDDLNVMAGSTLDMNFVNVYVQGQQVHPGTGVWGEGTIIPEPASLGLIGLGAVMLLRRRRT